MSRIRMATHGAALLSVVLVTGIRAPLALAGDEPSAVGEPSGELSLSHALALGLARNPELASFSSQIRASEARALQAGLLPNPELGVEVEDIGGGGSYRGAKEAQTTLRLSQLVELGGKRGARRDAAGAMRDVAGSEYEMKRVEVLARVSEEFVEVLATQHEVALTEEATKLAEAALQAAQRRVRAGKTSPLEEKKAAIALARSRIEHEHAEHELKVARKELAATWASTSPVFARVDGDLFAHQAIPPYEALAARVENSPDIARWVSERRLREAEIALADAKRTPDLNLGAGVRRLEGPDTEVFVAEISVPLPVLNRNQGGAAEARALAQRTGADERSATIRLHTVLFGLYQELLHAATATESLQKVILPQSKEALTLSQKGFEEGRFSYLDLVDAQKTFVDVRAESIETALSYHRLQIEIERLLGQPLDAPSPQQ